MLALFGLCGALVLAVLALNSVAVAPILDADQFFSDLRDPTVDSRWIYLMVFSTLLPTLVHLLIFAVGIPLRFPTAPVLRVLVGMLTKVLQDEDTSNKGRKLLVITVLSIWATAVVGAVYLLWHGALELFGLHFGVIQPMVTMFWEFAAWIGAAMGPPLG